MARTINIRCTYGAFGREIAKFAVIHGAYIRFWPTLQMCNEWEANIDISVRLARTKHNVVYM